VKINYTKIGLALDYMVLERKLNALVKGPGPPKIRRTVSDVLEPVSKRLLELSRQGWTSKQISVELAKMGIPVSPSRLRDCIRAWKLRRQKSGE
jgi:hypothetical protein